ncbi:MAG: PilZ domain-containing protein [Acidobacteriota bacterium]
MHGFCDSCEESADSLFDLTQLPAFREVVRRLNYRKVCQSCYDDLDEEIRQQQERAGERRSEARYSLRLRVDISGIDREGQKFIEPTFTEDVSLTGARISTDHDVEVGSVMTMSIPDINFEAAVIIELVWHNGTAKCAGLKLVEANDGWVKYITQQVSIVK